MNDAKPAPAPLQDPREVAHELVGTMNMPCPYNHGGPVGDMFEVSVPHSNDCDRAVAAILADRDARPDVAQLRDLLEEGARLENLGSLDRDDMYRVRAWARRVREVLTNSVDEL